MYHSQNPAYCSITLFEKLRHRIPNTSYWISVYFSPSLGGLLFFVAPISLGLIGVGSINPNFWIDCCILDLLISFYSKWWW